MNGLPRSFIRIGLFLVLGLLLWALPQLASNPGRTFQSLAPSLSSVSSRARVDLAVRLQVLKSLLDERFETRMMTTGRAYNAAALDRLTNCTLEGTCGPGEHTVVILGSFHFGNARAGHVSGEDIWAHSTMVAFEALNYTMLYAYGAMDTLTIYQQIPDLVPIVIVEGSTLQDCVNRNATTYLDTDTNDTPGTWQKVDRIGCIKREGFEEGIPIWKVFVFHFWPGPNSPLGSNWTLSPEDYKLTEPGKGNHYLGYSIEDRCKQIPYQKEREHRALILAKVPSMLEGKDFAWKGMLEAAAQSIPKDHEGNDFVLVSTAGRGAGEGGPEKLPEPGVVSLGRMKQAAWWHEVAKSKAMLGVGRPFWSPSPYDALCFGVPFINVIFRRDENDPQNKDKWWTMHNGLNRLGPPYIYHVKEHNADELHHALADAASNPIDRYIPPWMSLDSVRARHRELVETDWRSIAEEAIAAKWAGGDSPFLL